MSHLNVLLHIYVIRHINKEHGCQSTCIMLESIQLSSTIMHDSSLDLFCQKAEEQANDFALTIEALAEALEVTVDYYLEEFHEVG